MLLKKLCISATFAATYLFAACPLWATVASSLLFFFAKLLQEKPKHASCDKQGRKPENKK